jgi:SAM-dependent methyltransferase
MSDQAWDNLHKKYAQADWINRPNIFAEQVIEFLPSGGTLLDLGAGQGQDSRFFAGKGFKVTSLDLSEEAEEKALQKLSPELKVLITVSQHDISQSLPLKDESFNVVYAHLSLHYFDTVTTDRIMQEIHRVLKPNGIFAFFCNSTNDPEYGTGEKIEEDYFVIGEMKKRYFSIDSARNFANKYFEEILCDNKGETYKDAAKGIHNLIRYVGRKSV